MKNQHILKIGRRIGTTTLLITAIAQIVTIILFETGFKNPEVEELHEICGFLFFGLVLLHIIIFRKSLKNMFLSKTQ